MKARAQRRARLTFATLLVGWCLVSNAVALNPIVIKGQKFFDSVTQEQFFIKGVAYQPRSEVRNQELMDPLADVAGCTRDAPMMKALGANVVRVYEVDPTKNHDECMKAFADNGLYLLLDIPTPRTAINRKHPEYDLIKYNAYKATVGAFAKYPHVLAFLAGNEVTNDKTNTAASPFVRAAIRDMKAFLQHNSARAIPVGYASNDDQDIRDAIKDYFVCGDEQSQADFFGVNLYEWCGGSSFERSGYSERTKEFENYGKPVFLSEYGCNLVRPREFSEVQAVYGDQMTPVWSGGVVYEWSQENNEYGLVRIANGAATPLDDYKLLQKVLTKVNPKGVKMNAYQPQQKATQCPLISDHWKASDKIPPTPSEGRCQCMMENLSCMATDAIHKNVMTNNANSSTIGVQLDMMCGLTSCDDITVDGTNGYYGRYATCAPEQKLSWLYHQYANDKKNGHRACDFNGNAVTMAPSKNDLAACDAIQPDLSGPSVDVEQRKSMANIQNASKGAIVAAFAIVAWSLIL
ncbi:Glucanosyltransferase-domain-containing protein [Gongronella butleri]|nr:Glucanosyltransferase-domain-containing protein [Gongronella butleri]